MLTKLRHDSPCQYSIRSDLAQRAELALLLDSNADLASYGQEIHSNNRFSVFSLELSIFDQPLILKWHRAGSNYRWWRRVSFYLRALRSNYVKRAFRGAELLGQAGISTIDPIAYWTVRRSFFVREGYFLYHKVEACCTLAELMAGARQSDSPNSEQLYQSLFSKMVELAKKVHGANLYHGDIATHNILVRKNRTETNDKDYELVLLDTDRVKRRHPISVKLFKKLFDMRCLRRLDFEPQERKQFLKLYLGKEYNEFWWLTLCFWKWWGSRPLGRARRKIVAALRSIFYFKCKAKYRHSTQNS